MLEQVAVGVLGVLCVWLSQHSKESVRRFACIVALISQPFWFYIAWKTAQWGVFGLGVVYLVVWLKSFYQHWIKPFNFFRNT